MNSGYSTSVVMGVLSIACAQNHYDGASEISLWISLVSFVLGVLMMWRPPAQL